MATARNTLQLVINGVNKAGPALQSVSAGLTAMGAAAAASVGLAVREAAQFELKMAEISTLLDGDTAPAIDRMGKSLLKLSAISGQAIEPLQKAQYDIISAGFTDSAAAMNVLVASTKLAEAGVTDVASAADLVTTAMNAMQIGANDVTRVTDVLFQIVRKGKTTLPQLSASLGNVFSTAKTAGVSIEEVGAAMAVLTAKGINTNESVTALNNLMLAIAAPTDEAAAAMKAAGVNLDEGLVPAMASLGTVGAAGLEELSKLVPNIRALKAAAAAGSDVDALTQALADMENAAGVTDDGFRKMQDTTQKSIDTMKASFRAVVIVVGSAFSPAMKDAADRIAGFLNTVRESPNEFLNLIMNAAQLAGKMISLGIGLYAASRAIKTARVAMTLLNSKFVLAALVILGMVKGLMELEKWLNKSGETPFNDMVNDLILKMEDLVMKLPGVSEYMRLFGGSADDAGGDIDDLITELEGLEDSLATIPPIAMLGQSAMKRLGDTMREDAVWAVRDTIDVLARLGDQTGSTVGQMVTGMVGLTESTFTVGEAFKGLAASIIQDLIRIGARILVAKALLKAFKDELAALNGAMGGGGGGSLLSGLGSAAGFALGGPAGGFIGGALGGMFASSGMMNVPGTPGLDRTMVLAGGGEMILSSRKANMMREALSMAQVGPGFEHIESNKSSRRRAQVNVTFEARRPFRRSEQIDLVNSVETAQERTERFRR